MKASLEKTIQSQIEREIGAEPDLLVLRNAIGYAEFIRLDGRSVKFPYGLGQGSPDLVCLLRAPDGVARWFCLEVKAEEGRYEKTQLTTIPIWRSFGALIYTVRSAAEARAALESARALVGAA